MKFAGSSHLIAETKELTQNRVRRYGYPGLAAHSAVLLTRSWTKTSSTGTREIDPGFTKMLGTASGDITTKAGEELDQTWEGGKCGA